MTYSEKEQSLAIVPKTSEIVWRNSVEQPEEERMENLREQIQNVLVREVAGGNLKSWADKVIGPEVLREREIIFPKTNPSIDEISVEYDGSDIPGLYVMSPGRNGYLFRPLSLINHYLVAHLDPRAGKGILNRIPKLRQMIKISGLDEGTGLILVGSACLGATCQLEGAAEWAGIGCTGAAVGCLLTLPVAVYEGVSNLVQEAKKHLTGML